MSLQKLSSQACFEQIKTFPLWLYDEVAGTMTREFIFRDFVQAFDFMTQIARLAEHNHHHPNWLNVYHKVTVTWTTHDVLGLSDNDFLMAKICDDTFNQFKVSK